MSKKTDYKRLWRSEKEKNIKLGNSYGSLRTAYQAMVDMLNDIKSGKIKLEEIQTNEADVKKEEQELMDYLKKTNPLTKKEVNPEPAPDKGVKINSQDVVNRPDTRQKVI